MNLWINGDFRICRVCEVKKYCYKKIGGNCEKTNYSLEKRINDFLSLYRQILKCGDLKKESTKVVKYGIFV